MFAFLRDTIAAKGVGSLNLDVHGADYWVSVSEAELRREACAERDPGCVGAGGELE